MSRKEYIVIACGIVALLLNAIFPPIVSSGYGLLLTTSAGEIATGILLAQSVGIVALTAMLTFAYRFVPQDGLRSFSYSIVLIAAGVVCLLPSQGNSPLLRDLLGPIEMIADLIVAGVFLSAVWIAYKAYQSADPNPVG